MALSNSAEGGYYNPAGLVDLEKPTLSAAGNFYQVTQGRRKEAINLGGEPTDLELDSFQSIPQIAAYAQRFRFFWEPEEGEAPKNAFGLSVVVAEAINQAGRVDLGLPAGTGIGTRSVEDETLYAGPSYARRLSDRISVGASLFYVLRQAAGSAFIQQDTTDQFAQVFAENRATVGNLLGLLGVRWSPVDHLFLGLTYQTPSLKLHADGSFLLSAATIDRTTGTDAEQVNDEPDLDPNDEIPQRLAFGVAYERRGEWAVAADLLVHFAGDFPDHEGTGAPTIRRDLVVNFSAGGETYVTPRVPLRAGVYSDFTAVPGVVWGVTGQPDAVDRLGFSVAIGWERENTSLMLGTVIARGWGDGVDNLGNKIDVESISYTASMAGSYKF